VLDFAADGGGRVRVTEKTTFLGLRR
jgi:hypothetical protein